MLRTYTNMAREYAINEDKQLEVKHSQDVGKILERCETLRNNEDEHLRRKEEFRLYAEVPVIFVEKWMQEYGITDMGKALGEIMFRKVNSEFTAFKTTNTHERAIYG